MTQIIIRKTASGEYLGFTSSGHAGYAKRGEDIVCAAVSALVINAVNSLEEIAREPMRVETDEEAGIIRCCFTGGRLKEISTAFMDSLTLGLSRIEAQYGKKHCKLTVEEVC